MKIQCPPRNHVIGACLAAAFAGMSLADEPEGTVAVQPAPIRIALHSEDWAAKLNWQKAPDGAGEFLPAPNINQYGQFEHDGCRYVATPLGVLRWRPEGEWRIVPELYGRAISPVGMRDGLLWAVEGDLLTTFHPSRWSGHLVALDPANWSTKKKVNLPDQPSASIVAVEQDGFWCLEEPKSVIGGRASHYGQAVIANYSMDGRELFRFKLPPGKVAQYLPKGMTATSNPLIYWAAVDPDAVWLKVIDYQGIMPHDAPIIGRCGFVHRPRYGQASIGRGLRLVCRAGIQSPRSPSLADAGLDP